MSVAGTYIQRLDRLLDEQFYLAYIFRYFCLDLTHTMASVCLLIKDDNTVKVHCLEHKSGAVYCGQCFEVPKQRRQQLQKQ